ncbi:hypothetical protein [Dongshaea marina]|uniref:hypothetical protein n=1 Tax=Dongshaea marina TaxID=2047966 RepID=UPI00131EE0A4|nr:hypothetical protein [Dongshaea marina]
MKAFTLLALSMLLASSSCMAGSLYLSEFKQQLIPVINQGIRNLPTLKTQRFRPSVLPTVTASSRHHPRIRLERSRNDEYRVWLTLSFPTSS